MGVPAGLQATRETRSATRPKKIVGLMKNFIFSDIKQRRGRVGCKKTISIAEGIDRNLCVKGPKCLNGNWGKSSCSYKNYEHKRLRLWSFAEKLEDIKSYMNRKVYFDFFERKGMERKKRRLPLVKSYGLNLKIQKSTAHNNQLFPAHLFPCWKGLRRLERDASVSH